MKSNYVQDRLKTLVNTAIVFSKKLEFDQREAAEIVSKIKGHLGVNSGELDDFVREQLTKFIKLNYIGQFVYQDYTLTLGQVKEFYMAFQAMEFDEDSLNEAEKNFLKNLNQSLLNIFGVSDNQVVVVDSKGYEMYTSAIESKITDDYLRSTLDTPYFK